MRYQPVHVSECFHVTNLAPGERLSVKKYLAGKYTEGPHYWQATCKSLGDCGHRHKTREAAEPCAERLRKEFTRRRSENAKRRLAEKESKS